MENIDIYRPINCDFYDHFEIHAMKKTWLKIKFKSDAAYDSIISKIKTLQTVEKEEFAILMDDQKIRLDHVSELVPLHHGGSILGQILDKLDFNKWADSEIISVIKDQKIDKVINLTLSHNYNALDIWINRMNGTVSSIDVWQEHNQDEWAELFDAAYLRIIKIINSQDLASIVSYNNLAGEPYQSSILDILTHLVNHSTYHRGQIIKLLQQHGLPTVSTDFIQYSRLR